mgnify:CR=1 FL=1
MLLHKDIFLILFGYVKIKLYLYTMTNEDKKQKKIQRAKNRGEKNVKRNHKRWERNGRGGMDCPYDVDMNGQYGTCTCGGENYDDCLGDI